MESANGLFRLEKESFDTIRSVTCAYIVHERELFENCSEYSKRLPKYDAKSLEAETNKHLRASASCTTNLKHLTIAEIRERLANIQISRQQEMQKSYGIEKKTSC